MVIELLKQFFVTNTSEYTGFPWPNHFLPEHLSSLYRGYYLVGSGRTLFLFLFGIEIFLALFARGIEKFLARLFIFFTILFYIQDSQYFINTEVYLNPWHLPVPAVPASVIYILFLPLVLLSFLSFRNRLKALVDFRILRFFDFAVCTLVLLSALPLYSGEL
jgi:hypothetical protein